MKDKDEKRIVTMVKPKTVAFITAVKCASSFPVYLAFRYKRIEIDS